jgi:hypothetical protein
MFYYLHIFFQVFIGEIGELPECLADKVTLLPDLLKRSIANSTTKSHFGGFERYRQWALNNGLGGRDILPARAFHVATYLASICQNANTASPIIKAFYSIKWIHEMLD